MPRTFTRLEAGCPDHYGATLVDDGINFAVWSPAAEAVELCLYAAKGEAETQRLVFREHEGGVWHGFLPGAKPGLRYGLRAQGAYRPQDGLRFNVRKLLVDPWALAVDRPFQLHPSTYGFHPDDPSRPDERDSGPHVPKAIVLPPLPALTPAPKRRDAGLIYELHVRGQTRLHPRVPARQRGTLAALRHPALIEHWQRLGVTTLELLPIAAWADDRHLPALGLANYWGYNPVVMGAVDPRLAGSNALGELRETVATLQAAGFEVLLDVVFNHTGEGDELGPTFNLRGLDNAGYYRLQPDDPARYINDMGCGNCLALYSPPALRLTLDSLRHWVTAAGVDGFRFDLAPALGRLESGFDRDAPLLQALAQDPLLRQVRLVAEPWDIGPGGHQVGAFRAPWQEWNDAFRDDVRRFWRGDEGLRGALATRLAGSADLFGVGDRPLRTSVNFITAHDGFTLADLVSYAEKHNEANGEGNRDGTTDNKSWNNGVEGPSDDPAIKEARAADQRALLATLILAGGEPMLTAGDEFGRTQQGNNNAYVQDNELSWLDWQQAASPAGQRQNVFVGRLMALRRVHPALQARRLLGRPDPNGWVQIEWLDADGTPMNDGRWQTAGSLPLALTLEPLDGDGQPQAARIWLAFQPRREEIALHLPPSRDGHHWVIQLDSRQPELEPGSAVYPSAENLRAGRGVLLAVETPDAS
ncbi:glycogen debranching protein GlgX [Pseudomonas sp. EpS/L25]|uniref:glycogen debranching protein GlgX n=1 Tax=Pseudomonas sp. EpS/L25 TaxID=1749078 RepID=UPI000743E09B|nr:glycogen debranching protein GlgX [Pseudomonas sp. EpS/L25]KUM39715.1 glycogen debranching protein [Pseudomonas sp. EpS/L25]